MKVLVITGAIASGKSTVVRCFNQMGFKHLDADQYTTELLAYRTPIYQAIVKRYGQSIEHVKSIDRSMLRRIILEDLHEKQWLESLIHPLIMKAMRRDLDRLARQESWVIIEIPLIDVAIRYIDFDKICVVECDEDTQRRRIGIRDGWTPTHISSMIDAQMRLDEYRCYADIWINNRFSMDDIQETVSWLSQCLRH